MFFRQPTRGKRFGTGMITGFPMSGRCQITKSVKVLPIKRFLKSFEEEFTQYIGIAVDEPARLGRIVKNTNQISLLQKYGYTEQMAFELCKKYDLLSPIYDFTARNGCWFCPNARDSALRHLRNKHRNLRDKLLRLEETPDLIGNIWNTLKQISIHDKEERFYWEDAQIDIFGYAKEQGIEI